MLKNSNTNMTYLINRHIWHVVWYDYMIMTQLHDYIANNLITNENIIIIQLLKSKIKIKRMIKNNNKQHIKHSKIYLRI